MTVEFPRRWKGVPFDTVGPRQPVTYADYEVDGLPPLDPETAASFGWLPAVTDPPRGRDLSAQLDGLVLSLGVVGLTLPEDFITYYRDRDRNLELDEVSVTGCWTTVMDHPVPSPVEAGAYLVRFFNDQQDCIIWALYLRPDDSSAVVSTGEVSWYDPFFGPNGEIEVQPFEEPDIYWCAPSFAEFAYRYWLECRLSRAEWNGVARADLPPELAGYRNG